jgi:hypothetical protein
MALRGAKELTAELKKIKASVRNATRAAAYAGGTVFRNALRQAAPTTNPVARRAIVAKRTQVPRAGTGVSQVGLTGPAFYLNILSTGAQTHDIRVGLSAKIVDPKTRKILGKRPRKKLVLAVSKRPGGPLIFYQFQGPTVKHPGLRGRNWIRPILQANKQEALDAVGRRYNEAITKAVS